MTIKNTVFSQAYCFVTTHKTIFKDVNSFLNYSSSESPCMIYNSVH